MPKLLGNQRGQHHRPLTILLFEKSCERLKKLKSYFVATKIMRCNRADSISKVYFLHAASAHNTLNQLQSAGKRGKINGTFYTRRRAYCRLPNLMKAITITQRSIYLLMSSLIPISAVSVLRTKWRTFEECAAKKENSTIVESSYTCTDDVSHWFML